MAWSHLSTTKPHLVYIILGGFTSLFMLCSSFIKERVYFGEASIATLCGVIFGPHAANLINPSEWGNPGNVDIITVEFSRIVLVVQCFAVGVELPNFYIGKHWRSIILLVLPVTVTGWLVVSLCIWWMITPLTWLESLVISACVTATDPILASSVVGKGKFAKRVPKHLRDLLCAESGCNDAMALLYIYLSLYLIRHHNNASEVSFYFLVYSILYKLIFGGIFGLILGYTARYGIKCAERHDLTERKSFLAFYFVVALFCAGAGSILGLDELFVSFCAGVGFSNDGWFRDKTQKSRVSNVIDLLLNLTYFVYFGTIIPWEQFNNNVFGLQAWRFVVIAIFVLLFRRIPIILALKPLIPDIKNWSEALFVGHFGPIGVGAIFIAILAKSELEHGKPTPLPEYELSPTAENYTLMYLIWPTITFLVISSILLHGSSIAVFVLGKHINTLNLTITSTPAHNEGPIWLDRLPRNPSRSRSLAKALDTTVGELEEPDIPASTLTPPVGFLPQPGNNEHDRSDNRILPWVQREQEHDNCDDATCSGAAHSAIEHSSLAPGGTGFRKEFPQVRHVSFNSKDLFSNNTDSEQAEGAETTNIRPNLTATRQDSGAISPRDAGATGRNDIPKVQQTSSGSSEEHTRPRLALKTLKSPETFRWLLDGLKCKMRDFYSSETDKRVEKDRHESQREPARAYLTGNTIVIEDKDGEVVKTYRVPSRNGETKPKHLGLGARVRYPESVVESWRSAEEAPKDFETSTTTSTRPGTGSSGRSGLGRETSVAEASRRSIDLEEDEDEGNIRFRIGGAGQRMTKDELIKKLQQLEVHKETEVVD